MSTKTKIAAGVAVVAIAALVTWRFTTSKDRTDDSGSSGHRSIVNETTEPRMATANRDSQPATVSGKVLKADGSIGLAGVVTVLRVDAASAPRVVSAASDGAFSVSGLESGEYRVSASMARHLPSVSEIIRLAPGAHESIELTLRRGGSPVTGIVRDITGGPVASAFVRLTQLPASSRPDQRERFRRSLGLMVDSRRQQPMASTLSPLITPTTSRTPSGLKSPAANRRSASSWFLGRPLRASSCAQVLASRSHWQR